MVKIVVFDLDGTLYDKHKHIDEDTVQTVQKYMIFQMERKSVLHDSQKMK